LPIFIAPGIALADGERLIWRGRPDAHAALRSHLSLMLIGLPVLLVGAWFYFRDGAFANVGGVAAIIGAALSAAPFLVAGRALATAYVITDRRVILSAQAFGRSDIVERALATLDPEFEILASGARTGHLYLAGGCARKSGHVDGFGKLAFRDLAAAEKVRAILLDACKKR